MGHSTVDVGRMKVTTFTPPPREFDPLGASERELVAHGLPSRPDPERMPLAFARWKRAMSRPWTYVVPRFRTPGAQRSPSRRRPAPVQNEENSYNWATSIAGAGEGDAFTWISAVISVPNPYPGPTSPGEPEAGETYHVSCWIGIDGAYPDGAAPYGSQDLLQVGVDQTVSSISGVVQSRTCALFFEWVAGPGDISGETLIDNFTVVPGDAINCLICATSDTTATIFVTNESSLLATSFSVGAPQGVTLRGDTAEWVVERPKQAQLTQLARFADVFFEEGMAGTQSFRVLTPADGGLEFMVDDATIPIAFPYVDGDVLRVARA